MTSDLASPDEQRRVAEAAWGGQRLRLARSAFYARKLHEAGLPPPEHLALDDLPGVPVTTKDELRHATEAEPPYGSHLAVPPVLVKRVFQTSGTTGIPSLVALTRADLDTWTEIGVRTYRAAGLGPDARVLTTFGAGPFTVAHVHASLDALGAGIVPVGPGDATRVLSAVERGLADTLLTTPSFALHLAARVGSADGVTRVIVGGEPGGGIPSVRSRIATAFGARVVEVMGIGDVAPSLFGECAEGTGMHFHGTGAVWPELIDDDGSALPFAAGARGELVYTHLRREAMPLLRFRSGDRAEVVTTTCPCGRSGAALRIEGRVDDMIIVRGVNVYPAAVQAVVAGFGPRVTGRIRVVRPAAPGPVTGPVTVEVEAPAGTPATAAAELEDALHRTLRARLAVRLLEPDDFGDASYKTVPTRPGD